MKKFELKVSKDMKKQNCKLDESLVSKKFEKDMKKHIL